MRDDEDKESVEHVRRPSLPWRESSLTECGLPIVGHPVITREQFIRKVRDQGKQRSAMTTCMTCWDTAQRHPTWEEDPVGCIGRELNFRNRGPFKQELLALAALAARHPEEFSELMNDQRHIVMMEHHRKTKRPIQS